MLLESIVSEQLKALNANLAAPAKGAEAYVEAFAEGWRSLGQQLLEVQLQEQIEAVEKPRRSQTEATPLLSKSARVVVTEPSQW